MARCFFFFFHSFCLSSFCSFFISTRYPYTHHCFSIVHARPPSQKRQATGRGRTSPTRKAALKHSCGPGRDRQEKQSLLAVSDRRQTSRSQSLGWLGGGGGGGGGKGGKKQKRKKKKKKKKGKEKKKKKSFDVGQISCHLTSPLKSLETFYLRGFRFSSYFHFPIR